MKEKISLPDVDLEKRYKRTKNKWSFFTKYNVSESFIEKNLCDFTESTWMMISYNQKLSWDFINKYNDKLDGTSAIVHSGFLFDYEKIDKYKDELDWLVISRIESLPFDFIERYDDKIIWEEVLRYTKNIPETLLEKNLLRLNWKKLCRYQKLSTSFLEKHSYCLDWLSVSKHQRLPLKFIEKYADKLYWKDLMSRKSLKLSSKLLRKFSHKLDMFDCWDMVGYQNIDVDFIKLNYEKINSWRTILSKFAFEDDFLELIKEKFNSLDWSEVSSRQNISPEFVVRNMDNIDFPYLKLNKMIDKEKMEEMGVYVMAKLQGKRLSWGYY